MKNARGALIQLQRIGLDSSYQKEFKRFTGSTTDDRGSLIRRSDNRLLIHEGVENMLSVLLNTRCRASMLCCYGTSGFKRIQSFIDQYERVAVLLDNDAAGLRAAGKLPAKVKRLIPTLEPGLDANAAHQAGRLKEWLKSVMPC